MTQERTPALLIILVDSSRLQWFVGAVDMNGNASAMVRSEPGNLADYRGQSDDEQLSFLRHRLSGAMQRGCDRLFGDNAKAARIVLIADDDLPDSADNLLPRLADHFHTWMTRPPIVFFRGHVLATSADFSSLECLAGQLDEDQTEPLRQGLTSLAAALNDDQRWDLVQTPKR